MHRQEHGWRAGDTFKERAARSDARRSVGVKDRVEFRHPHLQRVMHQVAGDDRPLPP